MPENGVFLGQPGRAVGQEHLAPLGRLDKALDEALQRGWLVVDMEADWRRVFAFE